MQRNKFVSGKHLTNLAICRMIRNHLHEVYGWNDGNYPESEIEEIEKACPVPDVNNLLTVKRYCQWGENLIRQGWDVDIHDMIESHAYVLNLEMQPLGVEILSQFELMKKIKTERSGVQKQIDLLMKKREELDNENKSIHKKVFKMKSIKPINPFDNMVNHEEE